MLYILIPSIREKERLQRLLDSIHKHVKVKYKIILNRNTFEKIDIELPREADFKILYNTSKNLGDLYRELYEFVPENNHFIFLEDDDYLIDNILMEDIREDITLTGYYSVNEADSLNWQKARRKYLHKVEPEIFESFEKEYNCFQISCFIARKKDIKLSFEWDNSLDNDFKLFMDYINSSKTLHYKKGALFQQTVGDNISFPKYNKDKRWSNDSSGD